MGEYDDVPDDIADAIIENVRSEGKYEGWQGRETNYTNYTIVINGSRIRTRKGAKTKILGVKIPDYWVEFDNEYYSGKNAHRIFDAVDRTYGSYIEEKAREEKTRSEKLKEEAFRSTVLGKK